MKNRCFIFLFLGLGAWNLGLGTCFAQQYNARTYSVEDGLAQSTVVDIIQDRRGYIWFATSGGISIYNGNKFQDFTTREGLITNRVSEIIEDKNGNIWIGTNEGIAIVSPLSLFKTTKADIINITTKNGLAGNSVRTILEDAEGNVWVGTTDGISKINRSQNEFETLKHLEKSDIGIDNITTEDGLSVNTINHIIEDSKGNIWLATDVGISKIIPGEKGQSESIIMNFTTIDELNLGVVILIFEDKKGVFWIATRNGLLKAILNQSYNAIKRIENISELYKDIVPTNVFSILQDNKDNLWFDRTKFDGRSWEYFDPSNGFATGTIMSSLQDREGNIWMGTAGYGVSKYIGKTFENYTEQHGLSRNNVRAIIEDKNGNIWIGTAGGVSKFHPKRTEQELLRAGKGFEFINQGDGILNNSIWSLVEDKEGNIWIGTGDGLSRYTPAAKGKKGEIRNFHLKDGLKNPAVMALFEDSRGNLWAGTMGGLSKFNFNSSKGSGDGFTTFLTNDGLIDDGISAIYEDSRNNLWFGTSDGISKLVLTPGKPGKESANTGELHYTFENFTTKDGLGNNKIQSISEDNNGNIWFATGRGISKYTHPVNINSRGTFKNYTAGDGLSSDTPYLLIFDNDGYLYVGTNKGVDKFELMNDNEISQKEGTLINIKHFGKQEGLLGIETNHNATCKDQDGNIWFGTVSGAIKYKPKFDRQNTVEPLTQISRIQLFSKDVNWSDFSENLNSETGLPEGLELAHDQNNITFDFIGISLTIPEKVRYRYKLEGLDSKLPGKLAKVTRETSVTYFSIPPGNYTFTVKACNNDGLWNVIPASFSFTVTPPYWRTWWFYISCVLLITGAIYGIIKIRERNLQKEKRILADEIKKHTMEIMEQKEKIEKLRDDLNAAKMEHKRTS